MSFRISGKHFFITWSQSGPIPHADIIDLLESKGEVLHYVVCSELHADGNDHRHAYVKYKTVKNFKNPRTFDLSGIHPKIEKPRCNLASARYCRMDGNFTEWKAEGENDLEDECVVDQARRMTPIEFLNHARRTRMAPHIYNEAKRFAAESHNDITEDTEINGNLIHSLNPKELLVVNCKQSIWDNTSMQQLLTDNLWYSLATPEAEKPLSQSELLPSQPYSSRTSTISNCSSPIITSPLSSTIWDSSTLREKRRLQSPTLATTDPFTFAMELPAYQPGQSRYSQLMNILSQDTPKSIGE